MTWALDAKVLDSHVELLQDLAHDPTIRELKPHADANGKLEVYASGFARVYRVKDMAGRQLCLRFWLEKPHQSVKSVYSRLDRDRSCIPSAIFPETKLFPRVFKIEGNAIPAVLMEWRSGVPLGRWITDNRLLPQRLFHLSEGVRKCFLECNDSNLSHGDLRASNLFVEEDNGIVRVGMIDLDSLRWPSGPKQARVVGGNPASLAIAKEQGVGMLEADFLDQAMTYVVITALRDRPSLWPGNTDDFLWLPSLRGNSIQILDELTELGLAESRAAAAVRDVLWRNGPWHRLRDVLQSGGALTVDEGWRRAIRIHTLISREQTEQTNRSFATPGPPNAEPVLRIWLIVLWTLSALGLWGLAYFLGFYQP